MFQTKAVEKVKTNILCSKIQNRAICEIMWKNIVEPDRPQTTTWSIGIACRITKATETHSEYYYYYYYYYYYCFSTAIIVARTSLSVTFIRALPVLFVLDSYSYSPGSIYCHGR